MRARYSTRRWCSQFAFRTFWTITAMVRLRLCERITHFRGHRWTREVWHLKSPELSHWEVRQTLSLFTRCCDGQDRSFIFWIYVMCQSHSRKCFAGETCTNKMSQYDCTLFILKVTFVFIKVVMVNTWAWFLQHLSSDFRVNIYVRDDELFLS